MIVGSLIWTVLSGGGLYTIGYNIGRERGRQQRFEQLFEHLRSHGFEMIKAGVARRDVNEAPVPPVPIVDKPQPQPKRRLRGTRRSVK